jgi:hypothetical protein
MNGSSDQPVIRAADLEAAVGAGVIERSAADRLLAFVQGTGGTAPPSADEESLRLITGFNDIFVTIGLALFLGALAYLTSGEGPAVTGLVLAAASWALAEIFTRKKHMALPSIALLAVFGLACFVAIAGFLTNGQNLFDAIESSEHTRVQFGAAGLLTAGCIAVHWFRFRVPVTVAAGCAALVVMFLSLADIVAPDLMAAHPAAIFLPLGLATFALAMWFDMSDRKRLTRRTDIAFWLHLLSAPLIVHPVVAEVTSLGTMNTKNAAIILALFLVLSLVALVIDRRALLVSSLVYLG